MNNNETFSELITLLNAPNITDRTSILEEISNLINIEEMRDESLIDAIPGFISLLSQVESDEKNQILSILSILVRESREVMQNTLEKESKHRFAKKMHELISTGVPSYIAQLDNKDLDTQLLSIYILGLCSKSAVNPTMFLKTRYVNEINTNVKFVLIRSITFLSGYLYHELEAMWAKEESKTVKYALSLAMVELSHKFSQLEIEHILRESLLHDELFEAPYLLIPYLGSVFTDTCHAVSFLPHEESINFFIKTVLQWENDNDKMTFIDIIEHLFDISGFPKRGKREWIKRLKDGGYSVHYTIKNDDQPPCYSYSEIQIQVMLCIIQCEVFWKVNTNLLLAYYLPLSKDDLTQLAIKSK